MRGHASKVADQVERAAQEIALEEPIDAPHQYEVAAQTAAGVSSQPRRFPAGADLEKICANPLRDEPHPAQIRAVRRFGIVGLIGCALGAATARWWKSRFR
jgi:hypothetical protein